MSTPNASNSPAAPHSTTDDNMEYDVSANGEIEGNVTELPPRPTVQVERMHENVQMPEMENPLDAAFDLRAYVQPDEIIPVPPGSRMLIDTALKVALPPNFELQIRPRSGLAAHYSIDVGNSPGTVDPGYRGEVKVILENRGDNAFPVQHGDRIAQAALRRVFRPDFEEVDEVPEDTERSAGGFGHTGI